jgi:phage-related minor tail protein
MLSGDYAGGIALIAASGFSAVGSGIFSAATSKHALGDVFGEMGNIGPKKFAYGGGVGMMDEAGPEAIIPLARMRNGALGVQARAGGSATIVNVIDQSSAKTVKETTETRGPSGEKIIQILIRDAVKGMIAEGKLDSSLASRYGVAAIGNTRRT